MRPPLLRLWTWLRQILDSALDLSRAPGLVARLAAALAAMPELDGQRGVVTVERASPLFYLVPRTRRPRTPLLGSTVRLPSGVRLGLCATDAVFQILRRDIGYCLNLSTSP